MNYNLIYDNLINFRKLQPAKGYTENHHIIMRCMGGTDDASNLVKLTGREHWVAHLLLNKIYRTNQTIYACHMMALRCEERGIPRIRNSRTYEYIRKQHAKLIGERNKKMIGEANSQFGTRWICNVELQKNKKISKNEEPPEGWINGRSKWSDWYNTSKVSRKSREVHSQALRDQYTLSPKVCTQCNELIPYEKRLNSFCNRTCKSKYTNRNRYK
jgi:hypothetical protein